MCSESAVEDPATVDKEDQLRRVLDRIQQLPVIPAASAVLKQPDPTAPAGRPDNTLPVIFAHHSAASGPLAVAMRRGNGMPAMPALIMMTTATSTIVVTMATVAITLNVMHPEPSRTSEPVHVEQARVEHIALPITRNQSALRELIKDNRAAATPVFLSAPIEPPERLAALPPSADIPEHQVAPPLAATESGEAPEIQQSFPPYEREQLPQADQRDEAAGPRADPRWQAHVRRRASIALIDRKRKSSVRPAAEHADRTDATRAAGIGDVLAGGL